MLSESFTIISPLSTEDATKVLTNEIEVNYTFKNQFRKNEKIYRGNIENNLFKIRRIINYTVDHSLPLIIGKIYTSNDKTVIDIKLKYDTGTLVFFVFWFGLILYMANGTSYDSLFELLWGNFIHFILLLIGIIMPIISIVLFKIRCKKDKEILNKIFDATGS